MMALPSLFSGVGRMDEAAMQSQLDARRGAEAAQLTPNQIYGQMAYQAGSGLTRGIGGLLGADMIDPELKRSSLRARIVGEINPEDEDSLKEGVTNLQKAGFPEDAFALSARLLERKKKAAEITSEEALAAQRGREKLAADPFQKLLNSGVYTPASLKKYKESSDVGDLDFKDSDAKTQVVDTVDGQVLINSQTGVIIANIGKKPVKKSMGEEIGEGLGILGEALAPALKQEGKTEGGFAATDYNTLGNAVAAGTASKRNVRILKNNLETAFTGSFSDAKEGVSSALIGLGLPIGDDIKNAVSATQLINAMGTRYVFPLIKNFPGALAAKELDRLEKTAPNTLQQPETIKRLVSLLEADLAENEFTYGRAKKYKETNKSVIGFNQADQKIEFQQKYSQLQDLVSAVRAKKSQTSSEAAQINALRKELGL